jgi:hypothetical protein
MMHRNDFIVRRSCPQGRRAPQSRSVHARLGQRELARAPGFARNVGSSPRQRLSVWTRPLFAFEAPPTSIQAKLQATALRDPSGRAPGRSGGQSKVRQFCRGGDAAEFGFLGPEAPRTWPVPVSRADRGSRRATARRWQKARGDKPGAASSACQVFETFATRCRLATPPVDWLGS